MRASFARLGLLLGSLAVGLIAAELALRAFAPARDVGPSFTQYDGYYGKRLKAGMSIVRVTPEFSMRFTTNSLGFRGPEPAEFPRRSVIFLGDSFTLGYGVADGQEFVARIRATLEPRGVPVVNAGVGDSGNGRWIKFLRRDAPRFVPRLVVLQLMENDFVDNTLEGLFSLGTNGSLVEQPIPREAPERRLQRWIEAMPGLAYSHVIGRLRHVRVGRVASATPTVPAEPDVVPPVDALTLRLIGEALSICAEAGWPVLGVLVEMAPAQRRAVEALFAQRSVPVVALPRKSERPDLYHRIDGHWNAAGHAFAAQRLLQAIDTRSLARP